MKWIAWGALALVLIAGLLIAKGNNPDAQAKQADRDKIARCVQARDDELSDLATRRFMRQACIQMDKEFQAKWGIESREL